MSVPGAINGLFPTPRRRAVLALIDRRDGKVRYDRETKTVRDLNTQTVLTDVVRQMEACGWLEVVPDADREPAERDQAYVHYRLTDTYGRAAIERGRR